MVGSGIKIGQYRNVVKAAGVIWKNLGKNQNSVEMLFSKMRQYKSNLPPYDINYVIQNDTPRMWWNAIDDNDNCLQKLALLIFDITPHNAGCERIFSNLGWIYGKKRLRLSLPKVEGMAKVRSYYMSMINKELKYFKEDCDIQELKAIVEETLVDEDDDEEENEEEDQEDQEEELIIPDHEVIVMIENVFNLEEVPYILDPYDLDENESIISSNNGSDSDNENEIARNENMQEINDYDIDNIALRYSN